MQAYLFESKLKTSENIIKKLNLKSKHALINLCLFKQNLQFRDYNSNIFFKHKMIIV